MQVILATRNQGKVREFRKLFAGSGLELVSLFEFPQVGELEEDGATFLENARSKARTVSGLTGRPALADDSGLTVAALSGRPGVRSARYAGPQATDEDNYTKLLEEMADYEPADRRAAFVCVLVLDLPDGREFVAEGRCEGSIAAGPRGTGGFGYDPVFFVERYGRTMAELDIETKNRISHRAQAAANLRSLLKKAGLVNEPG